MTGYETVRTALVARQSRRKGKDCQCPAHDDDHPSLGLSEGAEGRAILYCQAGCSVEDVVTSLGLQISDLFSSNGHGSRGGERAEPTVTYDYADADGRILFQKLRYYPKDFRLRRPDENGGWLWSIGEVPRVLFRLPQVLAAVAEGRTVYIAEGEKDVLALERAGVVATCNFEGAARDGQKPKWRDAYSEVLRGADVVVVADRDEAGYAHAEAVRSSLERVASNVAVVEPAEGNDAHDHLIGAQLGLDDFRPVGEEAKDDLPVAADLSGPITPVRFAVPQFAPRRHITTFFATLGTGKTSVVLEAIAAHEAGRKFLGLYDFEEPQRFVYFDWENGEDTMKRYLTRLGADPADLQHASVYCDLNPELINLDTDKGRENVCRVIERDRATCVIFDGRDSAFAHTGENEGDRIHSAMQAALRIAREMDVAFVFVSQEPKAEYSDPSNALRGHSAWGQWSEQMFRLIRHGNLRLLQHTKYRAIDQRPSLRITLNKLDEEGDIGRVQLEAIQSPDAEQVMEQKANDILLVEGYIDEQTDQEASWGDLMQMATDEWRFGDTRLRNALKESKRIRKERRGIYTTAPESEDGEGEDGGEQLAAP
jgi:hypothetical protein